MAENTATKEQIKENMEKILPDYVKLAQQLRMMPAGVCQCEGGTAASGTGGLCRCPSAAMSKEKK